MIETKTLFYIVLLFSILFAYLSQGKWRVTNNGDIRTDFSILYFFVSGLIPWYFLTFTDIGVDYPNYVRIINEIDMSNYNELFFVESGFALFSAVLKIVFNDNIDAVLFIFKSFSIVLPFISIYILRDKLNVCFSVFVYMLLLYLPSFYLISQAMAAAIVLLSIAIYYKTNKIVIPLVILIAGGFIHNSVFIFIPVATLCHYLTITKLTRSKAIFIMVGAIVLVAGASSLYGYAVSNISGFHYVNYGDNSFEGSGLYFFVKYLPLFFIVKIVSDYECDKNNKIFIFVFVVASAVFNLLSYQFRVIERMEFLLLANYIFFLPIFIKDQKILKKQNMPYYSRMTVILLAYLCFIGYGVIEGRTSERVDMAIYTYFNPFK